MIRKTLILKYLANKPTINKIQNIFFTSNIIFWLKILKNLYFDKSFSSLRAKKICFRKIGHYKILSFIFCQI